MKVGVLQFFGWLDRSVPLSSIYDMALERIAIMDTDGLRCRVAGRAPFLGLLRVPVGTHDGRHGGGANEAIADRDSRVARPLLQSVAARRGGGAARRALGRARQLGCGARLRAQRVQGLRHPGRRERVALPRGGRYRPQGLDERKALIPGNYYSYDGVEVLPKPLQTPHPPVWMAATSMPAIDWAAAKGFSILMDPHSSRDDLIRKRRYYGEKLAAAGHNDAGRVIPMARLIAIDETADKAREVARRAADWTLAAYVGPSHGAHHRQEARTFGGKDPVDFYLEDVMLHGTAESVADQIRALANEGMTYLMAAPLSRRSFALLTDKVLPRIGA